MWVVDSTPVECGRSRETAQALGPGRLGRVRLLRLATPATSGGCGCTWCAPCTGCRSRFALTGAKADERQTLLRHARRRPRPGRSRPAGQTLIADKNYYGREFETDPRRRRAGPAAPGPQGRSRPGPGARFFKPLRQIIESVNDTFKGQLDLERHGGRTPAGVVARVLQRILALTAAIWHNDNTGQPDQAITDSPTTTDPLESII